MLDKKTYLSIIFFLVTTAVLMTGCEKEYSYEGGAAPQSVAVDTTGSPVVIVPPADPGALPTCTLCSTTGDIEESSWSFKTGNAVLCGRVDTAFILNLERSTFTFFGPATCGADTGLIFTVSLGPNALSRDTTNLAAANAVFYYYHTSAPYILLSHADQPFYFTITSYNHTTKMLSGTFNGTGFRQDGRAVLVSQGKFKIKVQ